MQAAPGAAKCSLGMASRVTQLRWRSSLLLSLTGTTLCTYHHYATANTTYKLHWCACTQRKLHASVALLPAFLCWSGCAMGTSKEPKEAVVLVIMPVMSVCDPSRWIAAKMGAERMVCMRHHLALTDSTGAPNIALYWSLRHHKTRPNAFLPSYFARGVQTSYFI